MDFLVRLGTSQPLTKMNTTQPGHSGTRVSGLSHAIRYPGLGMAMLREKKQVSEAHRSRDIVAYVNANAQNTVIAIYLR